MNRLLLVEKVLEVASKHAMFVRGTSVVAAVSGGPDSTALLHVLWSLQSKLGISLAAAHFEHGVRGEESLADAEFVRTLCSNLDVPLHIEHADIPGIAKRRRLSVQQAARLERHRFLREVAASLCPNGSKRIAIGHNADDRAETILLNILRGAGTDGLAAMSPVRLPIVRPLINCFREEIEAYCNEFALNPRTDSSNKKLDYTRNRVRAELLPHLAAYYNTGIREALLRIGSLASEDSAALNTLADDLFHSAVTLKTPNQVSLDPAAIALAPRALQSRVVRAAIGHIRGDLTDIDLASVDAILDGLKCEIITDRTLASDGGDEVHATSSRSVLDIRRLTPDCPAQEWQVELPVPGLVQLPVNGWQVLAERYQVSALAGSALHGEYDYIFHAADIGPKLTVRTWRAGDKMRPKGMAGTKKLQDLYTDCKVRSAERHLYPVLTTVTDTVTDTILAVLGLRADERSMSAEELRTLAEVDPQAEVVRVAVES